MIFLSLLLDMFLFLFGGVDVTLLNTAALDGSVSHEIHGHEPGPPDGHNGSTHEHHGQHGHTAGASGHDVFH